MWKLWVIIMLGFIALKGNLTLGMGFYDTWKLRACIWELLSLPERCWASSTWSESGDLCWACSSVFSRRFPQKISLFASCRSCRVCSARLGLASLGEILEFPKVRISAWSSRNLIHRNEARLWLNLVGFSPWFKLGLSENFVKKKKSQWSGEKWAALQAVPSNTGRAPASLRRWGSACAPLSTFPLQGYLLKNCTQQLCAREPWILVSSGGKRAFYGTRLADGNWAFLLKIQMLRIKLQSYKI